MAIENTVSRDLRSVLRSTIVYSVFDCRLSGMIEEHILYFMVIEIVWSFLHKILATIS